MKLLMKTVACIGALQIVMSGSLFAQQDVAPPPQPSPAKAGNSSVRETPPTLLKTVDPDYSDAARWNGKGGTVVVSLIVDENGMPQNVRSVSGPGFGLNEKAVEAVQQYRFKPAMRNGAPVRVSMFIRVTFRLGSR